MLERLVSSNVQKLKTLTLSMIQFTKWLETRLDTEKHSKVSLRDTSRKIRRSIMDKYLCPCGYEYDPAVGDPENGVPAGTVWEDVPEDWLCPWCSLGKDVFEKN